MTASRTRRSFLAAAAGVLSGAMGNVCSAAADGPRLERISLEPIRWLAFYGVSADEAVLARYDIVVLDPGFHGSLAVIADKGTRVCGYVSLGEIRTQDPLVNAVDPAALLAENPDWPGTRRVDIRHPSWRELVLERRIPALAARGFTGLMFDTLDTAAYLEQDPAGRYPGMRKAAIALVQAIRAQQPEMTIIMNGGTAFLPDLIDAVDGVIAESFMTSLDRSGKYYWVDAPGLELRASLLELATRRRPPLPILSLDYWDPGDPSTIREIYRRERALGHHPYVATRALDQIVSVTE